MPSILSVTKTLGHVYQFKKMIVLKPIFSEIKASILIITPKHA